MMMLYWDTLEGMTKYIEYTSVIESLYGQVLSYWVSVLTQVTGNLE